MCTNKDKNQNKKLPTEIAGLDAIFHGGIHTHKSEGDNKGIVMLTRGQHGVNKIHISMQICEGLNNSFHENNEFDIIVKRNTLIIKYNEIRKLSNRMIDGFKMIISSCSNDDKMQEEKKKWEKREEVFRTNYWEWFIGIAPKLLEINDNEQKEELAKIQRNTNSNLMDFYIQSYKYISENVVIDENKIEDFLKCIYKDDDKKYCPKLLFISLNKDDYLLKNSYYDFYIQRLIRDIRMNTDVEREYKSLILLHSMLWGDVAAKDNIKDVLKMYEFPSITDKEPFVDTNKKIGIELFKNDIKTGFIYYNGRTHGLHVRHQKGAEEDTGGMLLCRLGIPDDYDVRIIGKDTLNDGEESADGLTTFQKMMRELDKYKNKNNETKDNDNWPEVDFIMIDGLSRLNEKELSQCPLNALSDKLRSKSQVAIITADKKLLPSEISTDIVLDMEILQSERPDHQYTALKVSKCLYQKNAYGWHRYKMRNAGIEVIPSIHLQMGQRFLMDDIVTDAVLPINEYPYPFWLNENDTPYEDTDICKAKKDYKNLENFGLEHKAHFRGCLLECDRVKKFYKNRLSESNESHHVLFVNFDKNRIEFYNDYIKDNDSEINYENIHLFNFQPGYIHTDEMLWALNQQILAIENLAKRKSMDNVLGTHYTHVSLVLGDLNYIHYAYPCLSAESLLLPALATYTKKHHMTNYVYATVNEGKDVEDTELHKKEIETIMQIRRITEPFEETIGQTSLI